MSLLLGRLGGGPVTNQLTFTATSTVTATFTKQVALPRPVTSSVTATLLKRVGLIRSIGSATGTIGTPDIKFFGTADTSVGGDTHSLNAALLGGAAAAGDILVVNTVATGSTVTVSDNISGTTGWIKIGDSATTMPGFKTTKWWKRCVGGETSVTCDWSPSGVGRAFEAIIARSLGTTCEAYLISEGQAVFVGGSTLRWPSSTAAPSGNGQVYVGCTAIQGATFTGASIDIPPGTHDNNGVGGNGQNSGVGNVNCIIHINDSASVHTTADALSYTTSPLNDTFTSLLAIRPLAGSAGVVTTATFNKQVGLPRPATSVVTATFLKMVGLPRPVTTTTTTTFLKRVGLLRPVTTTVTATALIQKVILILAAVSSAVTATFTKQVGLPRPTTTTTTATFTKQIGLPRPSTSTVTATFSKLVGLPRSVASNVTATFNQRVGKLWSAASTTTATFLKSVGLTRSASSVTSATLTKQVGLPRPVTTTTTATFTKRVGLIRSATSVVASSYNFIAKLNESVTSTVTATYFRATGTLFTLTFTATSVVTATYNQQVGKAVNVVVNVTPSFAKVVALNFAITTVVTASYLRTFPSTAVARLRLLMGWGT